MGNVIIASEKRIKRLHMVGHSGYSAERTMV